MRRISSFGRFLAVPFLALVFLLLIKSPVDAHECVPTSGTPHCPTHNEDAAPGFTYSSWTAPYNGTFSVYAITNMSSMKVSVTLTRVGGGSGGGTYSTTWNIGSNVLSRLDTNIPIHTGEVYNITVQEQDQANGGWYNGEGWLPPRIVNLAGGDIECGIGDHPFNAIMVADGGSTRFAAVNVYNTYTNILANMVANNSAITASTAPNFIIKAPSISFGDNSLGIQCWGDNASYDGLWKYKGISYSDDVDFDDLQMVWAFNPTNVAVPTVNAYINSAKQDYVGDAPASYTVSWSSSNTTSCTGTGSLAGYSGTSGSVPISGQDVGSYTYGIQCTNGITTVSDARNATIYSPPTLTLMINALQQDFYGDAPASYNVSWSASHVTSCIGSYGLSGFSDVSRAYFVSGKVAGTYTYAMQCTDGRKTVNATRYAYVYLAPVVNILINGVAQDYSADAPAGYTVSWSSANATSCTGSGSLAGRSGTSGSTSISGQAIGTYTYSMSCTDGRGTATGSRYAYIYSPPTVAVSINGLQQDFASNAPAAYTVSWASTNATSCSGSGGLTGKSATSGSLAISGQTTGSYSYTMQCSDGRTAVSDTRYATITGYPLSGTITRTFDRLVLYASEVGQPAQTLSGTATGGTAPYTVKVWVQSPSGARSSYSVSGSSWTLTPAGVGNPNFGTTEEGAWTAWAVVTDSVGNTYTTASANWTVKWFNVHQIP